MAFYPRLGDKSCYPAPPDKKQTPPKLFSKHPTYSGPTLKSLTIRPAGDKKCISSSLCDFAAMTCLTLQSNLSFDRHLNEKMMKAKKIIGILKYLSKFFVCKDP